MMSMMISWPRVLEDRVPGSQGREGGEVFLSRGSWTGNQCPAGLTPQCWVAKYLEWIIKGHLVLC